MGDYLAITDSPGLYYLPNLYMSEVWNCNVWKNELGEWSDEVLTVLVFIPCMFWLCSCLEHSCLALEIQKALAIWANTWKKQIITHNCHVLFQPLAFSFQGCCSRSFWCSRGIGVLADSVCCHSPVCSSLPNQGLWALLHI